MDSRTGRGSRPEIIAPAGNPEKLRFAVAYGADAVYFGGGDFNLRAGADNFSEDDLEAAVAYCASRGVKTVFLMNSFLHEGELGQARKFASRIARFPFNAVMISDPGMMDVLRNAGVKAAFHLSTQMSTLNHLSAEFWRRTGVSRIVLARETTLEEVRLIRKETEVELEIFVHGALCVSYSGRCLLSRYLTGRDANRGDCTHPCRWRYSLLEEKRPGQYLPVNEDRRGTEILASKDLCLIRRVRDYAEAGVNAFKIEGRMKSLYYAANTVRIYRHALRASGPEFEENLPFYERELDLVSHRPYTEDPFNEFGEKGFSPVPYISKARFAGYREGPGRASTEALVKAFNPIRPGDRLEVIYPIGDSVQDHGVRVLAVTGPENNPLDLARPAEFSLIKFDREILDDAIFRVRTDIEPGA